MNGNLHPTRFFSASTETLDYLIEEWTETDEEEETLREAGELIAKAEGDIFEERSCPDCSKKVQGTSNADANKRLENHRSSIHQ